MQGGVFKMHLKWRDQPLKTITFIYRLLYENLRVTANQNSILDIHAKKAVQKNTKNSHYIIRKQKEEKQTFWTN